MLSNIIKTWFLWDFEVINVTVLWIIFFLLIGSADKILSSCFICSINMLCDGMVNQSSEDWYFENKFPQYSKVYILQKHTSRHVDFSRWKCGWILKRKYHKMFSINLNSNSKCPMLARGGVGRNKAMEFFMKGLRIFVFN